MKRDERQRRILSLLSEEAGISAGTLAQRLGVSRMTIHRDLESLGRKGLLQRVRGGAVFRTSAVEAAVSACGACGALLLPHQRCHLQVEGRAPLTACCAACGLRQLLTAAGEACLEVSDLLSGRMLPAEDAFFLVNSMASPCCRPSLLSFADEGEVTLFQTGFGGSIARLDDALEFLRVAENLSAG